MLGDWAFFQCCICDRLGGDGLPASLSLIGGDEHTGLTVIDPISERLGGEASKNNRMDRSEPSAGKERDSGLGDHG